MTYRSKRSIASMVAGVAIMIAYIIYAKGSSAPALDDIQAWAIAMLICIGIGVAINIIIQILFHIGFSIGVAVKNQDCDDSTVEHEINSEMVEDEMSKTISLKASYTSNVIAGVAMLVLLVILATGSPVVMALNALFLTCMLSSLAFGATEIFFNERGVH